MGRTLVVTADDTTGALESAARAADEGWTTTVVPFGSAPVADARCTVIDLRSRHLGAGSAAQRMQSALRSAPVRAHKIDSTLRGNWPDELAAAVGEGRRVLVVPAYPAAGRTCVGGVVFEHGSPLDRTAHIDDPRSPVRTARPASLLAGAAELASLDEVDRWLAGDGHAAVADAADEQRVFEVVNRALEHDDLLIVGTAAVIGAVARCMPAPAAPPAPLPSITAPVLVVCGSLHPASRDQVDALVAAGAMRIEPSAAADGTFDLPVLVVSSPNDRAGDATAVAVDLAHRAHALIHSWRPGAIVLLGGDTAEAVIGARAVNVAGSLDVGVAIGTIEIDGRRITVTAKPGAFGGPATLVDLMRDVLPQVLG